MKDRKTVCEVIDENALKNKNAVELLKESGAFSHGEGGINFAPIERHSALLRHVASEIIDLIWENGDHSDILQQTQGWCGMPVSGQALACVLAQQAGDSGETFALECISPQPVSVHQNMEFIRHKPKRGQKWFIVTDVLRDFDTANELSLLLAEYHSSAVGIVCFCNITGTSIWSTPADGVERPIISLVTGSDGVMGCAKEPELGTKTTRSHGRPVPWA